jgi:hypothetical protein
MWLVVPTFISERPIDIAVSSEFQGLLCSFVRESVIYIPVEGLDQGLKKKKRNWHCYYDSSRVFTS